MSGHQLWAVRQGHMVGVNFGSWLLIEPWVFDQIGSVASENDYVTSLRRQPCFSALGFLGRRDFCAEGDAFALRTMRNHWEGFISDAALDVLRDFGVTHARIPIGYWLLDAPVGGSSPLEFGFQEEGFATGGLNELQRMLPRLRARGMRAMIDLHSVGGCATACNSYAGVSCAQPLFWSGEVADEVPRCGGDGPAYTTSRADGMSWLKVGHLTLRKLARWVISMHAAAETAGVVDSIELVNEPGLGTAGLQHIIQAFHAEAVPQMQAELSAVGVRLVVNHIWPNDRGMGAWLAEQVLARRFPASLLVDYHHYFNWDGALPRSHFVNSVCDQPRWWGQYTNAGLRVVIGEWSLATDLDRRHDLDDADTLRFLKLFAANQQSAWLSDGNVVGNVYWTLRTASGWDPRPTPEHPNGRQLPGTSETRSLPEFGHAVWSFLEMVERGVLAPLPKLHVRGLCECAGCGRMPPTKCQGDLCYLEEKMEPFFDGNHAPPPALPPSPNAPYGLWKVAF